MRIPSTEQHPRGVYVIDLFGLSAVETREKYPQLYQHLLEEVKPERDQNNRASYRVNWWIHGEPRRVLRGQLAGLPRYIATVETAKHPTFQFLDKAILPDNKIVPIALSGASAFAQLSSRAHVLWAMRSGSWLGVGNDSVYVKTRCFETFPFPELASPVRDAAANENGLPRRFAARNDDLELAQKLAELGEQLDAHRKRQQAAHSELTLTGMYNVLEKLKSGEALNAKEKIIHEQGLVSVLKSLHDEIDLHVLEAYGWADLKPLMQQVNGNQSGLDLTRTDAIRELDEALPERLVALNAERAQEEKRGLIRYLRPEFQDPNFKAASAPKQSKLAVDREEDETAAVQPAKTEKISWPKTLPEQVRALLELLKTETLPAEEIAARFKGLKAAKLGELLETLVDMGRARETEAGFGV